MVPSTTFRSVVPSLAAAAESSMARASAQAKRTAVPLSCTDWLPAVWPSLRERGADALPELNLAAENSHRAVRIDAQPRVEQAVGVQTARQSRCSLSV